MLETKEIRIVSIQIKVMYGLMSVTISDMYTTVMGPRDKLNPAICTKIA